MKRTSRWIFALTAVGATLGISSCCCSLDGSAPPLRPLPEFQEIPQEAPKAPIYNAK